MSQKVPLRQSRQFSPRCRPSIRESREVLTKKSKSDQNMDAKDESTNIHSDDEEHDSDQTSSSDSENDDKNSEISNYSNQSEDSFNLAQDEQECSQTRQSSYIKESVSPDNIKHRLRSKTGKVPNYISESKSMYIKSQGLKATSPFSKIPHMIPEGTRCAHLQPSHYDEDKLSAINNDHSWYLYLKNHRWYLYLKNHSWYLYLKNLENLNWIISFMFLFLCVSLLVKSLIFSQVNTPRLTIEMMKGKFTTQNEELWLAFKSGVDDVVNMSRPSTFILLYKKEAEETLKNLLDQLSKYATCTIIDCSQDPIEISGIELNTKEVLKDYGILIAKYRDILREKGVMVIKDLETIPGTSAQAFHSFCDEFTPLVDKSLFIFTMKVDKLPRSEDRLSFVEEYFRNKWTDINVDTFNALITRITSMVIEIKP